MNPRVAIIQHRIIKGGRLAVLARMVKILNEAGIIPDIIAGEVGFNLSDIPHWYGYSIKANVTELRLIYKHLPEYQILHFNKKVNPYIQYYNWVLNSSNTSHFLNHPHIFDYVHYPRYTRILDGEMIKNQTGISKIYRRLEHSIVKWMYQTSDYPEVDIYANSEFTRLKMKETYAHIKEIKVLYPPVSIPTNEPEIQKTTHVVNVGRFHPSKGQFDILKLARKMPEFHFSLVGFANKDNPFLKKCLNYADQMVITNVSFYLNASREKRNEILNHSTYYLHLMDNEPFGISTVQGIAYGCIPIVPHNGGQTEIVENNNLLFDNQDQIPNIIKAVHALPDEEFHHVYRSLFNHIQIFNYARFDREFNTIIRKNATE